MKRSKILFLSVFASFLAIAAFSGVMAAKNTQHVEKVEAATATTIYCKMEQSWWTADGAAVGIHYWGGTSSTNWPGVRMTGTGTANEWKYTVPSGTTNVIFTRVNSSGTISDWGAKTKDQTLLIDGTNYCTITSTSPVWGNPGCDVSWSVKKDTDPVATTNQFYVFDPHNVLSGTIKVYGFDDGQKNLNNPDWPGVSTGITSVTLGITSMKSVVISTSYPSFIMNNGTKQTVNVSISGNVGKVLVIENNKDNENHYYTHWSDASLFNGDYPSSTGYYIYGSKTSWSFTGATKMSAGSGDDVAQLLSYSGKKDEKIKVRGYYTDREDPNIYSFYDGGDQPFGKGDGDANFVFSADMVVDIFAKYVSGDLKFYVNEHFETDGYIMTGDAAFISATGKSGLAWSFNAGTVMDTPETGTNKGSAVVTVTSTSLFRVRKHINGIINWLNFPTAYDGTDGITRTSEGNVQLQSGTYAIYVDASEGVYVVRGVPLDAFCSDFLNQIKNVCKTDGSTVLSQLKNTWSSLSSLYSQVFDSDKSTIYAIGFNGGSDVDDAHKVVKAYHYIVTKYGTANCNDFIWNQNVTGTYNQRIAILGNTTIATNNSIIVVVVVGVAALAVGGYFLLRKKKEN